MLGQTNGNANYESEITAIQRAISNMQTTLNNNARFPQISATSFSDLDTKTIGVTATPYLADVSSSDGAPNSNNRWGVFGFTNSGGTYAYQMALSFSDKIYTRFKSGGAWQAWRTI